MTPLSQARTAFLLNLREIEAYVEAGKATSDYQELWLRLIQNHGDVQLHEWETRQLENLIKAAGMGGCCE